MIRLDFLVRKILQMPVKEAQQQNNKQIVFPSEEKLLFLI